MGAFKLLGVEFIDPMALLGVFCRLTELDMGPGRAGDPQARHPKTYPPHGMQRGVQPRPKFVDLKFSEAEADSAMKFLKSAVRHAGGRRLLRVDVQRVEQDGV